MLMKIKASELQLGDTLVLYKNYQVTLVEVEEELNQQYVRFAYMVNGRLLHRFVKPHHRLVLA